MCLLCSIPAPRDLGRREGDEGCLIGQSRGGLARAPSPPSIPATPMGPWTMDNPYLHTSGRGHTSGNLYISSSIFNQKFPGLLPYRTMRQVRPDEQYPGDQYHGQYHGDPSSQYHGSLQYPSEQYQYPPYYQPLFSSLSGQYCCPNIMEMAPGPRSAGHPSHNFTSHIC